MTQQTQGTPVRAESTAASREAGRSRTDPTYYLMVVPALVLFLVFLIDPFLQGIFSSLTNYADYGDWAWIGLSNYQALFRDGIVWESYRFAFHYAVTCTILVNVFALFVAWLLNQKVFGRNGWRGFFFIPNVLPVLIVASIFTYLFSDNLPAIGERLGIGWLSTNILANEIPMELEEVAVVDGASRWTIFWRVIFPLMAPMNATVGIFTFLWAWNDFMMPLLILSDPDQKTLPLAQYVFQGQFTSNYTVAFASYTLAMLPVLLVYLFAQRWVISGVMRGGGT